MRWQGRRQSTNVRDERGAGNFGGYSGGLGGPTRGPFVVRRSGGGIGLLLVILVVAWLLGVNPLDLLQGDGTTAPTPGSQQTSQVGNDEAKQFVATVLADTEDVWTAIFAEGGKTYPKPMLTLFSGGLQSGCGFASAAVGPFYCPADRSVYIDLSFFDELKQRFGAPGDFAQAYVIAHEVGHHVQNVLGILSEVHRREAQLGQTQANALSVKTELQADCFAGVWANRTEQSGWLDPGDIEEGLNAAAAVGDDRLQKQSQGYVVPDSFTHGTSEQRVSWFKRGYKDGKVADCDTFNGRCERDRGGRAP